MLEFPREADRPTAILLMAVVRADRKVLKEETEMVHSFFAYQLRVPQERLRTIGALVRQFSQEEIPELELQQALSLVPESARDLLFAQAVEIAIVDDDLAAEERRELLRIGRHFGLSDRDVKACIRQAANRREDAFSLLDIQPEATWEEIEDSYYRQKQRYAPSQLAELGVAFQNLALERLDRIEWAYRTLSALTSLEHPEEDFPEASDAHTLVLKTLALPPTLQGRLDRAGVRTRDDLKKLLDRDHIKGMQARTRMMFDHLLSCIKQATDCHGRFQREQFDEFFPLKPAPVRAPRPLSGGPGISSQSEEELWSSLPSLLQPFFQDAALEWDVLCERLGLFGKARRSLKEVGEIHGMPLERARQFESKARRRVRAVLLRGEMQGRRTPPEVVALGERVFGAVGTALSATVSTLDDYREFLRRRLGFPVFAEQGLFLLFEEWAEVLHDDELGIPLVFKEHSAGQIKAFNKAALAVRRYLESRPGRVRMVELLEALEEHDERLRCELEYVVTLAPGFHRHEDGSYSAHFEALSTPDQAYRILHAEKKAIPAAQLAARINARLAPERRLDESNLRHQLITDDRFYTLSREGEWSLREWDEVETGGICDVLERILEQAEESLTVHELTRAVREHHDCSDVSVLSYLARETRFQRTGPAHYALTRHVGGGVTDDDEEVGVLVESFFRSSLHADVPFHKLVEYLVEKSGMEEKLAATVLRYHPSVIRSRTNRGVRAGLRKDWRREGVPDTSVGLAPS